MATMRGVASAPKSSVFFSNSIVATADYADSTDSKSELTLTSILSLGGEADA
jgi:hypothetical protein